MDPLSSTASVFAVLSLAIQLAQSTKDIKRALDAICNASAEATRLRAVVLQLHCVAASVRDTLEHQNGIYKSHEHVSNIYLALEFCIEEFDAMARVMQIAEKVSTGKTSASRVWASVRLAYTSDQIDKMATRLERAMSFLNANLLLNLTFSNIAIHSKVDMLTQTIYDFAGKRAIRQESGNPLDYLMTAGNVEHGPPTLGPISTSSSRVTWENGKWLNLQYFKRTGQREVQMFVFKLSIFSSRVVIVKLLCYRSFANQSVPFSLATHCLIPDDAEIMLACKSGDGDRVRTILESKSGRPNDITPGNLTPLSVAISGGHEEVVQLLLREGAEPDLTYGEFDTSPLQAAVMHGKLNIVRILVAHRADSGQCSAGLWSTLHFFFGPGMSLDSIQYASVFGEDLCFDDIKDTEGWTALHRCAAFGSARDIHLLHRLGASTRPNRYTTKWGWTPVHVAAIMNNKSTLEALVHLAGSKLGDSSVVISNLVDSHGWTPLHLAVHRRARSTTEWLLSHGADPRRRTYRTAGWFPPGFEGYDFDAAGLARLSGEKYLIDFVNLMRDTGYDVSTDGDNVYW